MNRSTTTISTLMLASAIVLASCGSSSENSTASIDEELTGVHAGETAEEHAAHVEENRIDQAAEEAAAEAMSAEEDDHGDAAAAGDAEIDPETGEIVSEDVYTEEGGEIVAAAEGLASTSPATETFSSIDPVSNEEIAPLFLQTFGITEQATVDCVLAEAADENISFDENPTAIMIASIRCDADLVQDAMAAELPDIDTSTTEMTDDQVACSFEESIAWIGSLELDSQFLASPEAPQELIAAVVNNCGVSEVDAEFFLNQ